MARAGTGEVPVDADKTAEFEIDLIGKFTHTAPVLPAAGLWTGRGDRRQLGCR